MPENDRVLGWQVEFSDASHGFRREVRGEESRLRIGCHGGRTQAIETVDTRRACIEAQRCHLCHRHGGARGGRNINLVQGVRRVVCIQRQAQRDRIGFTVGVKKIANRFACHRQAHYAIDRARCNAQ
jgi:hypothetical protein